MLSLQQIEELLRLQLERAQKSHDQANREFWRVSAEIPSGLPYPDCTQRIQNAARAQNATRSEVVIAMNRFNAFLSRGVVPPDLMKEDAAKLDAAQDNMLHTFRVNAGGIGWNSVRDERSRILDNSHSIKAAAGKNGTER